MRSTAGYRRLISWLTASLLALSAFAQSDERDEVEALVQGGFHQQALERIEELLQTDPRDVRTLFLKAIALAETGRADEAITILSDLAAEHPEMPEPHNNLAVLHATRGDYEAARGALLAAIAVAPDNARYRENLGDVYAHLAAEAYEGAIRLAPPAGSAAAKLELIRELFDERPRGAERPRAEQTPAVASPDSAAPATAPAPCAAAVEALHAWAEAWSSQDVEGYLGCYSETFSPAGDLSRELWEAQRRARVGRPRFIEVSIIEPQVEVCAERRARLVFTQDYRSDTYRDRVRKELWMSRAEDGWTIIGERSLD